MLVRLTTSGKASWANDYILKNMELDFQIVSSDVIIEEKIFMEGPSYTKSHKKYIEFSIGEMECRLKIH